MDFSRLELSVGKVILIILFLDSFACFDGYSLNLPRKEFMGIPKTDSRGADGRWFTPEGSAVPRRSRSNLKFSPSQVNGTPEAQILLEFRKGVSNDPFNVLTSWNSNNMSNYCKWPGVLCSSAIGRVSALKLSGYQLRGSISPSLAGLQFLSSLNLSKNFFEGTIPTTIANCSHLTVLDLSNNRMSGSIPTELVALSNLEELYLSWNAFTGVLPPSLSNLSALSLLNLEGNQIDGHIMSVAWGGFQQLQMLNLSINQISGGIPESLTNCSNLVVLDLSFNNLTGSIPLSLGSLKALGVLALYVNSLTGPIPASLVNCSALALLYLCLNQLTGEIPPEIGKLSELEVCNLWNNSLTGSIPPSVFNCTSLFDLELSFNFLGGEIPQAIGTLSKLGYLELESNNFVGGIPASLGNCSSLLLVELGVNRLIGEIPSQLGLLNLTDLYLSKNFLTGQIPASLWNSTSLFALALGKNRLSGQIPPIIGELPSIQLLNLTKNLLTGGIPAALSNCTGLYTLDLSGNLLSESLPNELGTLPALSRLYLNNNNFTGSISPALKPSNLIDINLAYNSFSGVISGYDFAPVRNLQLSLDLSHNMFSGPLPSGIGTLSFVQNINLSFNSISGVITDALSQCAALESLDLSSNNLNGKIPQSLTTLRHLTFFNVSFNQLIGPIPDSGQFTNFTNGSFLGNPNLCGAMVSHNCSSSCSGIHCHHTLHIIISIMVAGVVAVFALTAIWIRYFTETNDMIGRVVRGLSNTRHLRRKFKEFDVPDNGTHKKFSERILLQTIDDSSKVIGVGARSIVYKGVLPGGETFAVKRLLLKNVDDINKDPICESVEDDLDSEKGNELLEEAEMLAKLRHKNIVKVFSFYSNLDYKALILEYVCGGSLHKHLHEMEPCLLTWQTRLRIAMGVAQGMKYLHHDFPEPLIHRDLKPSNILLDADFEPKVADFGISKFVNAQRGDGEASASAFCGTIGYMPPEYGSQTWVSIKGDVYSYGMVLIELLTGRQPCSTDALEGEGRDLRKWVLDNFHERPLHLLDPALLSECSIDEIRIEQMMLLLKVSIFCTRLEHQLRPCMIDVVGMLVDIVNVGSEHVIRTIEELVDDTIQL